MSGLIDVTTGLARGIGLFTGASSLWSGAPGLVNGGGGAPPVITSFLLLADASSYFLLADGASKLQLAG